jgi:hypothetical protein
MKNSCTYNTCKCLKFMISLIIIYYYLLDLHLDGTSMCVSIGSGNQTGLWTNQLCTNKAGLVCKATRVGHTAPPLPPVSTSLPPCDPGLIQTPNYCYQVFKIYFMLISGKKWSQRSI